MLEAIVVCVNYADYLNVTLPYLKKVVDRVLVITDCEDDETAAVSDKHAVSILRTNVFYRDGAPFNKGAAINEGLKHLDGSGWVLHIDADIVLTEPLPLKELDPDTLYTVLRKRVFSDLWDRVRSGNPGNLSLLPIRYFGGYVMPIGYFQLWHHGNTKHYYPECFTDASDSDSCFALKWPGPNRALLPGSEGLGEYVAYHLETRDQIKGGNWKIRTSQRFQELHRPVSFTICSAPSFWGNNRSRVQACDVANWTLQHPRTILLVGNKHGRDEAQNTQGITVKHIAQPNPESFGQARTVQYILEHTVPGEIIVFPHPAAHFCDPMSLSTALATCSGTYYNFIAAFLHCDSHALNTTGFFAINRALLKVLSESNVHTNQPFNEWLSLCSDYNIPIIDLSPTASISEQPTDFFAPQHFSGQKHAGAPESELAITGSHNFLDDHVTSDIANIQVGFSCRVTHILQTDGSGAELAPYCPLEGLSCLGLSAGADVIVMRSAPIWRMRPVLRALRDMGCITHLIVQRDVAAEYEGLCNHSYLIEPGPFANGSIPPEMGRALQSIRPAAVLVVYFLPPDTYCNIHAVLQSLDFKCLHGGIEPDGALVVIGTDIEPSWLGMLRFVKLNHVVVVANAHPDRVLNAVYMLLHQNIGVQLIVHRQDGSRYDNADTNIDIIKVDPDKALHHCGIHNPSPDLVLVIAEKLGTDRHVNIEHELAFMRLNCPWVRMRPGHTLTPITRHWGGPWLDALRLNHGDHVVVAPSTAPWQVKPYLFRLVDAGIHVHLVVPGRDREAYAAFSDIFHVINIDDWNARSVRNAETSPALNQAPRYILIPYDPKDINRYTQAVSHMTACGFTAPLIGIGEHGQLRPIKSY